MVEPLITSPLLGAANLAHRPLASSRG